MKQIIFSGLLIFILTGCTETKTESEYLSSAQLQYSNGNYQSAVIEAKNTLKINEKNAEARLLLARLHQRMGDPSAAEKELQKAAELGVDQNRVVPLLAQVLLEQRKNDELMRLPAGSLKGVDKAEFLANQGLAFLADGDVGQAENLIQDAIDLGSESVNVELAYAQLKLAQKDFSNVRKILQSVLEATRDDPRAWSLMGRLERYENHLTEAEAAFTKVIKLSATNDAVNAHLKRAESRIQLKDYPAAQKDLDVVLKKFQNHPLANFAQGQVHQANRNVDEAMISFEKAIRVQPDFAPALLSLSVVHFQKGNFEQAEQYGYKFLVQAPDSTVGARLLGIILFQNNKLSEAEKQLRGVLKQKPDDVLVMNVLSSVLFKAGKRDEALELLNQIASQHPDSALAQLRLGAGLLAQGDTEAGEKKMEKALALNPEFQQAEVMLILHHIYQREFDQAMRLAEQYRDKQPESASPYNLIGQIFLLEKDFSQASEVFSKAASLKVGDVFSNNALALLAVKDKKLNQARSHLETILKYDGGHYPTLIRLAEIDAMENDLEKMQSHLNRAIDARPKSLHPRMILARYWMSQKEPEKALGLFQGLTKEISKDANALSILASLRLATDDFAAARLNLLDVIALKAESAPVRYMLARAYAGEHRWGDMEKALRKAIALRPEYFDARLSLASYLANKDPKESMEHLQVLKKLKGDDPQVLSLDAVVQNKLGAPENALITYQKAFEDVPNTQNLILLVRQKIYMKDRERAVELLEAWLVDHPEDLQARLFLASEYIIQGKSLEMIKAQYETILKQYPDNTIALNNLAWNMRNEQPAKALELVQRADAVKPNSASILDTLAVVQLKNNLAEEAKLSIRKALLLAPDNTSVRFHAAVIDQANGDLLSASERLRTLLQDESNFPERGEAEALLKKMSENAT